MDVLGSGPEGRTCSKFDCSTGRKNLACPCFDQANEMNEENSRSFPLRDLGVNIDNRRQLWRWAPLFFRNLEKSVSSTQVHWRL